MFNRRSFFGRALAALGAPFVAKAVDSEHGRPYCGSIDLDELTYSGTWTDIGEPGSLMRVIKANKARADRDMARYLEAKLWDPAFTNPGDSCADSYWLTPRPAPGRSTDTASPPPAG